MVDPFLVVRAVIGVAWSDGEMDTRELALVRRIAKHLCVPRNIVDRELVKRTFKAEEVRKIEDMGTRRHIFRVAAEMAFADAAVRPEESGVIGRLATALRLAPEEVNAIWQEAHASAPTPPAPEE